jgi:hypothetical protein
MLHNVMLEARKERAWNSPDAQRRRACAEVNEEAAESILRGMTDVDLVTHINTLDNEHQIKSHALKMAADALARALIEKWRRSNAV